MDDPLTNIKYLIPVEECAEEILRDKSETVALDRRRNENREGLRALTKISEKKIWMGVGPLLLKLPTEKAKKILNEDQKMLDIEVNKIRSELKVKVNKLNHLELQTPVPGFDLKALSKDEFSAFMQTLGGHV